MIEVLLALSICTDWSPRLAADYLDNRQKEWFAWKTAQTPDGPCVSCHTGTTYLLVRPELRRKLGETQPTSYETGLLKSLHGVGFKERQAALAPGVQVIHSALFTGDFDRMWSLQIKEGKDKGAWKWFHLDLDPWEMPESTFYGATLAALATRKDPGHPEQIALLRDYLKREQAAQPLHNRLMLLWSMPDLVDGNLVDEVLKEQEADGGWSMESLGPWKGPSRSTGSDAYATGLVTYTLLKSDIRLKIRLNGAINWLKSHQNREGFWPSTSMNKEYPPDSMMVKFMQDAATGFAVLALLEAER
jgi:squalene-hopene/tetraprenyl-beta-curcumene cyclase